MLKFKVLILLYIVSMFMGVISCGSYRTDTDCVRKYIIEEKERSRELSNKEVQVNVPTNLNFYFPMSKEFSEKLNNEKLKEQTNDSDDKYFWESY